MGEYFVPRAHAVDSLRAVHSIAPVFAHVILVSEVRSVAADGLLLSPHAEDRVGAEGSVALHFTWRKQEAEVMSTVLPVLEKALEPFQARPHWGKLFAMSREKLEQLYGGALSEFRSVMHRYDPEGRFCNTWVRNTVGAPSAVDSWASLCRSVGQLSCKAKPVGLVRKDPHAVHALSPKAAGA